MFSVTLIKQPTLGLIHWFVIHRISPTLNTYMGAATNSVVSKQMSQNHHKMYFGHVARHVALRFRASRRPETVEACLKLRRTFSQVPETQYTFLSSIGLAPSL
jgi:hypothetical protein